MDIIVNKLFENKDLGYRDFHSRLIPNIDKNRIIGVRTPILRKLAKEISKSDYVDEFLKELPHKYNEENMLHGMILPIKYKKIDLLLLELDKFLEYVDNWAITDMISPKIFKKYPDKVYKYILKWINSNHEYKMRFGIVSLLQFYLDENYNKEILNVVSKIDIDYFYVKMAIAWFYSFALIKQYDDTIIYFENRLLDKWIHNKSIQKAIESYRVDKDRKEYLRSLKIK